MIRIAIIGPECSGKTTLARALAAHFKEPCVPEYAREFLLELDRPYVKDDLLTIANGQLQQEAKAEQQASQVIFCDTEMITFCIWSQEKFDQIHPKLQQFADNVHYDHYLLCSPEMEWEADPLRENEHDRERLFDLYRNKLDEMNKSYHILSGNDRSRVDFAINTLNELLA